MVTRYTSKGYAYGVPPYTKAEENELYRQAALKGPVTILRGAVAKTEPPVEAPPAEPKSDD